MNLRETMERFEGLVTPALTYRLIWRVEKVLETGSMSEKMHAEITGILLLLSQRNNGRIEIEDNHKVAEFLTHFVADMRSMVDKVKEQSSCVSIWEE